MNRYVNIYMNGIDVVRFCQNKISLKVDGETIPKIKPI